jgi:predicted glycosyltransferase
MTPLIVLFFSCEPGGAEVLIPVIKLVQSKTKNKVIVLSYGLGAERFARQGISHIQIERIEKDDPTVLSTYHPDLIITSAASLPERDMSEKYLWHNARSVGIPSIAFLDQWQNYVPRFSGEAAFEQLAYLPDHINCINDIGEREMIEEGFDPNILLKLGHPYLSAIANEKQYMDTAAIRKRLGVLNGQRMVMFVTEAIKEHYGRSRGYDQYDAFKLFLELISKEAQKAICLIKIHPKDTVEEYEEILRNAPGVQAIIVKDELNPIEAIQIVEEVYGMTSIMLIEAYILGKRTISLQPGLVVKDPCLLSRYQIIPAITLEGVSEVSKVPTLSENNHSFDFRFKDDMFLKFLTTIQSSAGGENE